MPAVRLTATNVPTLPADPGKKASDYRDALLPGLVLRVTPAGVRTWVVEYHVRERGLRRGKRHKLGRYPRLGLADARDRAMAVLRRLDRGESPEPASAHGLTVSALVGRCLEGLTLRPKTRHEWERLAKAEISGSIGLRSAAEVGRGDVREWQRAILPRSGWIANRAFELLRRAYTWGLQEELVERSPCDHMPKLFEEASSERVLSREELRALMASLDERYRPTGVPLAGPYADAVWLLLLTGVRKDAVLGLRRDELALDGEARWAVPVERSKGGRPHVVPLSRQALDVVKRRLAATSGSHLFPCAAPRKRTGDVPMAWSSGWIEDLCLETKARLAVDLGKKEVQVPRWTIHNLRQAVATHLMEDLHVSREIVSAILGHAPGGAKATRVYARADLLPERRAALIAWGEWLEGLLAERGGGRLLSFSR